MNGENKPKIVGWRKMGIGISAITALSLNPTIDFKIAVIIGTIAFIGIVCQGVLDYEKKKIPKID
jgi:hypothetical protein